MITIRIFTFLSGCILALLKAACISPLKKMHCCEHKKLVTGNEATVRALGRKRLQVCNVLAT